MVTTFSVRAASNPAPAAFLTLASPIGRLELHSDGRSITSLTIESDGRLPSDGLPEIHDRVLEKAATQLDGYFSGSRRQFSVPISPRGTRFQRAVWDRLSELAWGQVTTYGALGAATGRATAGRAVGGAIRANPIPIIVPCHRVLGVDRTVTGYSQGAGIPTKLWLLEHEGVMLAGA